VLLQTVNSDRTEMFKLHTRFRLVPKSTASDGHEWPLRMRASYGASHENSNEDRPTLSATKPDFCSFWQYKVHADIRGGSLKRGRQKTTVGWSRTAIFSGFCRCILGTFRNKTNIIIGTLICSLVPRRLSLTTK